MLGDKIDELAAKVTGSRVVPIEGGDVRVELSIAGQGKVLGIDATELATYHAVVTPAGVMNGEGQGLIMSKDGDSLTWRGHGVGKPTGAGLASSWRYSIVMRTTSSKWARLNGVLGVGEWELDDAGNGRAQIWEWK